MEDPAFVCLVVIDDPTSKHCHPGGGTVCAPIFQKLATRLGGGHEHSQEHSFRRSGQENVPGSRLQLPRANPAAR